MLTNANNEAQLREETVRLACGVARKLNQPTRPPKVTVRFTSKWYTTGRCVNKARIHLTIPKGASVPQALALICHEVGHFVAPTAAEHGPEWREAFAACLAMYEVTLDDLGGTKEDVHARARQALAERLRLPQVSAADPGPVPAVGVVDPAKREEVLRKVAKILALAAGNSNEHEASSAAVSADRLLRAFRLTMADVTAGERDTADPMVSVTVCYGTARTVHWKAELGFDLGRAFGCFPLSWSGASRSSFVRTCQNCGEVGDTSRHAAMQFTGRKSSVLVCEHVYTFLLREIDRIGVEATRKYSVDRGAARARDLRILEAYDPDPDEVDFESDQFKETPRTWGASFRLGAARAAVKRLRAEREADLVQASSGETALVLTRRDYAEAQEYAYATNDISTSYDGRGSSSAAGRTAGEKAGSSIRVNTAAAAVGGAPKRLTG